MSAAQGRDVQVELLDRLVDGGCHHPRVVAAPRTGEQRAEGSRAPEGSRRAARAPSGRARPRPPRCAAGVARRPRTAPSPPPWPRWRRTPRAGSGARRGTRRTRGGPAPSARRTGDCGRRAGRPGRALRSQPRWPAPCCSKRARISRSLSRWVWPARSAALGDRVVQRDPLSEHACRQLARGGGHLQLIPAQKLDHENACRDQRSAALGHERQDRVQVGLATDRARDLDRRVEGVDGPLELVRWASEPVNWRA